MRLKDMAKRFDRVSTTLIPRKSKTLVIVEVVTMFTKQVVKFQIEINDEAPFDMIFETFLDRILFEVTR